MKKYFSTAMFFLIFTFVAVQVVSAQMINYNRRNKKLNAASGNSYQKPKASSKAAAQSSGEAGPAVTNRVERLYDLNRDGFLQKAELSDFYKDVVSSVKNKGKFEVSSDLLKQFDADQDGQITMYEVKEISKQIN